MHYNLTMFCSALNKSETRGSYYTCIIVLVKYRSVNLKTCKGTYKLLYLQNITYGS